MAKLEDILDIPVSEGRRGLERAKAIVREIGAKASKPEVKTKPGTVKKTTKVVE